ncbi:MAG: hypothetical protein LC792_15305 [Actinobacteria bacterium]|nr:hypothetical protein [Actinomycetota bacterium]
MRIPEIRHAGETCDLGPQQRAVACADAARRAGDGLHRDFLFILAYVAAGVGLALLGAFSYMPGRRRKLLIAAAWAAAVAGLLDCTENLLLLRAMDFGPKADTLARAAAVVSTAKWALLPMVVVGAVVGLVRFLRGPQEAAAPAATGALDRARRWEPPATGAWAVGERGICFSGGGIRSASFSLGTLQRLQEGDPRRGSALGRARYLAAVSGGGYMAGAAQLLAAKRGNPAVFGPGSPEEDHLRRHANYLADSSSEWWAALVQTVGKLLANVALVGLLVFAAAQPIGWMGRLLLAARPEAVSPVGRSWPVLPQPASYAFFFLALPAALLAAGRKRHRSNADAVWASRRTGLAASLALALGFGAALLGVAALGLPLLDALGRHLPGWLGRPKGAATGSWPSVVVVTLLGRVVHKALRRETSGGAAPADPTKAGGGLKLPFAKNLTEVIAGPVIALVLLGYFSAFAALGRATGPKGTVASFGTVELGSLLLAAAAGVVVLAAGWWLDAVNWSMHRFYKRRLWSAFAYSDATGGERDWTEPTTLSVDGVRLPGTPELVLCGVAEVSGPSLAPPRRRAVTWTFDSRWVGGPEIGWCETIEMERALGAHGMAGDISLFGAVAISGAAFGSAMGRHSMGSLNSAIALANARLGVWLPNPAQVRAGTWAYRRRHLGYVVREVFGRYSPDAPWVLTADGGHYENLGLVELFRHRCTGILCFDGSGDGSGALTTVAEALRLAEDELGVTVRVDAPWLSAPGGGAITGGTERLADALRGRLARAAVVRGEVTYPEASGLPAAQRRGWIVVGRSVIDQATPWPVLSYAAGNEAFPNDPTADQWFDHEQFANYRLLGRSVAERALTAAPEWWA